MSILENNLNQILNEKTTKIIPENIKKGVTIFNITGTLESSENLQEQLDAQDTIITELQTSLDNKASSTDIKPNIFMQLTEPVKKEGIWFKSDKQVDHIIMDTNIIEGGNWDTINEYPDLPMGINESVSRCIVGDYIYLFNAGLKYNIKTNTTESITTISSYVNRPITPVAVGKYIYLFCDSNMYTGGYQAYKYDTEKDTYTSISSLDISIHNSSYNSFACGKYIYIMGYQSPIYKYDTEKYTYTTITISNSFSIGKVCAVVNDNVYIFDNDKKVYKWNTTTNEFTPLNDAPQSFRLGESLVIGNNIYITGGYDSKTTLYQYNIVEDTYTKLNDIPRDFYKGILLYKDNKLYLLGGDNYTKKVSVYVMNYKEYDNNSIIVWSGNNKYMTQLYTSDNIVGRLLFGFYKAYYYTTENKLDASLPLYYGNGEEWIKISGGEE